MEMLKPPVPAALFFGLLTLSSPSPHVRGELGSQSRQDRRRFSAYGCGRLGDVAAHGVGLQPSDSRTYWRERCGRGTQGRVVPSD